MASEALKNKFCIYGEWCEYTIFTDDNKEKYWFVFDKKYNIRRIMAKDELECIIRKKLTNCNEKLSDEYLTDCNVSINEIRCYCFIVKEGL